MSTNSQKFNFAVSGGIKSCLLVTMVFWLDAVYAYERVDGLYEAEVILAGSTDSSQRSAIGDALRVVIEKKSGAVFDTSQPQIRSALSSANQYVFEFGSTQISQIAENGISIEEVDGLWVKFDQSKVDDLMFQLDIPIWPSTRPEMLVWMVTETAPNIYFYMPSAAEPAGNFALDRISSVRGLPVLRPGYTEIEQLLLPAEEAWNLDVASILRMSERYEADLVSVVRYRWNSEGRVEGDIQLISEPAQIAFEAPDLGFFEDRAEADEQTISFSQFGDPPSEGFEEEPQASELSEVLFSTSSETLPLLIETLFAEFVDGYAVGRTFKPTGGNRITLTVEGITSFADYHKIVEGFSSMEMLEHVTPNRLTGSELVVAAELHSNPEILRTAIVEYLNLYSVDEENYLRDNNFRFSLLDSAQISIQPDYSD